MMMKENRGETLRIAERWEVRAARAMVGVVGAMGAMGAMGAGGRENNRKVVTSICF